MMKRLASFAVATALATAGCQDNSNDVTDVDPGESTTGDAASDGGHVDPIDPDGELSEPYELEPAPWTPDLHSVVMNEADDGTVMVDALNNDGLLVARVELDEVDGTVYSVRAKFADMSNWTIVDTGNAVVLSSSSKPQGDDVQIEIAARIQIMWTAASEQKLNLDANDEQRCPPRDCPGRAFTLAVGGHPNSVKPSSADVNQLSINSAPMYCRSRRH